MFNNVALDVFIGLIFVFLLYSLLATIIQEIIATRFAIRAKVLEKAILRMLEDGKTTGDVPYLDRINGILHIFNLKSLMKGKKVAPWFYAHPLIKYLAEDNWYSKPAIISCIIVARRLYSRNTKINPIKTSNATLLNMLFLILEFYISKTLKAGILYLL